jgi:hypothetical protein
MGLVAPAVDLAACDPKTGACPSRYSGPMGCDSRRANHTPLMHLASRSESTFEPTRVRAATDLSRCDETPFHEVLRPSTFEEASSDSRWICLAQLRCTFRFSQPLGALFHSQPFQPCFMLVTPLGFANDLQRIPPPDSRHTSRCALSLMPFIGFRDCLHSEGPFASRPVLVVARRSCLSWP